MRMLQACVVAIERYAFDTALEQLRFLIAQCCIVNDNVCLHKRVQVI
jgi:hypothetical protein